MRDISRPLGENARYERYLPLPTMSHTLDLPLESPIQPGLMVIHGNRMEDLRDLLTGWLARAPLRPLEDELMLVQSNGIAQWLKWALARPTGVGGGLGISAAIDVQLPGRFLWAAYRSVLGRDAVPTTSPFDKSRLSWRLLRLLPAHLHEAEFAPLRDFLRDDPDERKRFQLAERVADLFDQYQVYRADWLADWEQGRYVLRNDLRGEHPELPADQRWQARLWQLLLDDVGEERHNHRAAVHQAFLDRIDTMTTRPATLPRRIVVFGISSLPQQTLEALTALARFSQVMLLVANPCRHYWADIIEDRELLKASQRRHDQKPGLPAEPRYEDLHLHANPLLAAWGRQGRDYIRLLDAFDKPEGYRSQFTAWNRSIDLFADTDGSTLLRQMQQAILDLEPLPVEAAQRKLWRDDDTSLRFHVAHGPQREVEILHDQLLAMFQDAAQRGEPLSPRDVIVMVPDIQTYAPHVQAVFGRLPPDDPRHLPFSVADQPARGAVPLMVALEHLLSLPESRFAVSDLLDLLDVPALRSRFDIDENGLHTLRRWIEGAGIRWGLDRTQKQSLELPGIEQNTWRFGLRRMLLGYAVGEGDTWHGIAPYGEVGGLDAALVGPLILLMDQLEQWWARMREPAAPDQWHERLQQLLLDFFDADDPADSDRLTRLNDALDEWKQACAEAGFALPLPLNIVREHWLSAMDESRLSQRFMGGAVSFCTLMPMRAIPFRVVCLLGMNDGDYPRRQAPADFDLMAQPGNARPGDRSRREDDRYLFLEALASARDTLYVSWVGRNVRDNSVLPPSVLVGQLRDYIAAGWHRLGDDPDDIRSGEHLLDAMTTVHPLQPFSRRYFNADADAHLFTYAREWRQALRDHDDAAMNGSLAPWEPDAAMSLALLQGFVARPVRHFFNHRLKVHFNTWNEEAMDEEPFGLNALERHVATTSVLRAAVTSADPRAAVDVATRQLVDQGSLPPGGFGELARDALARESGDLATRWRLACERWPLVDEKIEVLHEAHGVRLEDWLTDLRRGDETPYVRLELATGKLQQKNDIRYDKAINAWVIHVVAHALGLRLQSRIIGTDTTLVLKPLDADDARMCLNAMLACLLEGMRMPLPVARKTAFAWLQNPDDPEKARKQAQLAYEGSGFGGVGEVQEDAYLARAWPRFDALEAGGFHHWLALYQPMLPAIVNGADA
ncbi:MULTISPECIES: exodeoxyribonuclease V subunit gamma [unclassified Dyella]|uniref:exodeoxyribonuclease V subunit gamma n=1 Tax=unclassified Dyella TaxID=2634549 RepID=UPI000CAD39EB|nr:MULTISPECIES: exodeoxyribonuclease V subunit gamma [unclassified Dyella]MDR3445824.1 exodeoxyribonuclease V subunit gamma [Dyella sp.]PMQ04337.1 RecBCD enzyme subunit RecC [Dyella sp. AD56]